MAKPMLDTDDVALWYALSRFMTRYWFDVDFNSGNDAHEFYLPDALFAVGENRFEGQDKIRAFYAKRQRRGVITGRHLINNLQVLPIDEHQVRLIGVLSLFYAQGHPPHHGIHPPMLVADIAADCVLGDDERWRFRSHVLSPLFVGHAIPISISVNPNRL
jgi:hypothetical protein